MNLELHHDPKGVDQRLMPHQKANLPTKICPVCQRPFTWRKKWARDWDNVVYCSQRCRRAGRQQ